MMTCLLKIKSYLNLTILSDDIAIGSDGILIGGDGHYTEMHVYYSFSLFGCKKCISAIIHSELLLILASMPIFRRYIRLCALLGLKKIFKS